MLRFFRKAQLLAVIMLLLVAGTMSSKDLIHSFVQHHTLSCDLHAGNEGLSSLTPQEKIEKHRFCAFCHLDNFTFTTSESSHPEANNYALYNPVILQYVEPVFSNSHSVHQLRGPPVTT